MATKGRKRNRKKSFWVTDSEWKAIEKIAAGTGMGIGEYLRISALGKTNRCQSLYREKGCRPCDSRNRRKAGTGGYERSGQKRRKNLGIKPPG